MARRMRPIERKFHIEMNAKNTAYSFILAMGLLEEFKSFSDYVNMNRIAPHKLAVKLVDGLIDETARLNS